MTLERAFSSKVRLGPCGRVRDRGTGSLYRYTMCKPTKLATTAGTPASLGPSGFGWGRTGAVGCQRRRRSNGNAVRSCFTAERASVSQRWVAWVGFSDEATRESVRGGPCRLETESPPTPAHTVTTADHNRIPFARLRPSDAPGREAASQLQSALCERQLPG